MICSPALAAEEDTVRQAIRSAEEKFARADLRRDVPAMMEMYAEDAVVFPPGGEPLSGKPAIMRWMNRLLDSRATVTREEFELQSLDVCGDLAIESGRMAADEEAGGAIETTRTQYLAIWKRQPDGSWKIQKNMWSGRRTPSEPGATKGAIAPASPEPAPSAPPPASAPIPAEPPRVAVIAPPSDAIPIPDPRGLSEGFVRNVADQVRSRVAKIRSLRAGGGSADVIRAAIARADRELRTIIRDVGWIDVARFGVPTSCDAAFIVAESGDAPLLRSTVPLMKDLEQNPEGNGCYQPALQAYRRITGP
jgi:ketosteroid isomerase-like protein